MDPYHQLYSYINRFIKLADSEFAQLKQMLSRKIYKKKELLVKAGEVANHLHFLVSGAVREYIIKDKHQVTTDIILENTITGSVSSFFSGMPSNYTLEAIEPVQTFAIDKNTLEKLYLEDVKWEKFGRLVTTHFLIAQEQFILDGLQYSARERFIHFFANNEALLQRVSQKYLASYLNIKPETFSRMKNLILKSKIKASKST